MNLNVKKIHISYLPIQIFIINNIPKKEESIIIKDYYDKDSNLNCINNLGDNINLFRISKSNNISLYDEKNTNLKKFKKFKKINNCKIDNNISFNINNSNINIKNNNNSFNNISSINSEYNNNYIDINSNMTYFLSLKKSLKKPFINKI